MTSGDAATMAWSCSACRAAEDGDRLRWLRNCETDSNPNVAWTWAPELRRCPWSQIGEMAWLTVGTWRDWRTTRETPWGSLMQCPVHVAEAVLLCERMMGQQRRDDDDD